ncbi:MAG: sn-glycerol-3-phosphate ABC transporter ATP-binding protein UgpC [Reyranellaceae bacterium]
MASITLSKLNKHYGALHHAVKDVDLEIADKEFVALVGPSGCGKSTTLRMIAGLEDISSGEIRIGDRVVNHLPPRDRDVAMVFQNYALYQHMSVYDNLAFGLRNKRVPEAEIKAAIDRAAAILGLHDLLKRRPRQLSGGQQQRVALGRCIVRNPQVFLFDEPLSNLDAKLRAQMRLEIKRLHAQLPTTSVFVTHDQVEAMTLGDRVVVMRDGNVQQVGTPLTVYSRPVNRFVAGFIGAPAMNFLDVALSEAGQPMQVTAEGFGLAVAEPQAARLANRRGQRLVLGLRPEHIALADGAPAGQTFEARVEVVEQLGSEMLLEVAVGPARLTVARVAAEAPVVAGDQVRLTVPSARLHFFDPTTELAL